jgi:hypothetical protein
MKKSIVLMCVVGLLLGSLGGDALSVDDVRVIEIQISPSVLVFKAKTTSAVTVHTDIAYSAVASATVELNGIPVKATFSDSRGQLVAKFDLNAVKDIVAPPSAVLTLTGTTKDGAPFAGSDTIGVK